MSPPSCLSFPPEQYLPTVLYLAFSLITHLKTHSLTFSAVLPPFKTYEYEQIHMIQKQNSRGEGACGECLLPAHLLHSALFFNVFLANLLLSVPANENMFLRFLRLSQKDREKGSTSCICSVLLLGWECFWLSLQGPSPCLHIFPVSHSPHGPSLVCQSFSPSSYGGLLGFSLSSTCERLLGQHTCCCAWSLHTVMYWCGYPNDLCCKGPRGCPQPLTSVGNPVPQV